MTAKNNKTHAAARLALAIGQAMEAVRSAEDSDRDAAAKIRTLHAIDLAQGFKKGKYQGQIVAWLERAKEDIEKMHAANLGSQRTVHAEGAMTCLDAAFEHLLE